MIIGILMLLGFRCLYAYTFDRVPSGNYDADSPAYDSDTVYRPPVAPSGQQVVWIPYQYVSPSPDDSFPPLYPRPTDSTKRPARTTTPPPTTCRTSTKRTTLGCPCNMFGGQCRPVKSVCEKQPNGKGICVCTANYVESDDTCVNRTISPVFELESAVISASCFLPRDAVVGTIPQIGAADPANFALTLLSSSPTSVSTSYIIVESATGNILYQPLPRLNQVDTQTFSVIGTDKNGAKSNLLTFTVEYTCSAPVCTFDLGNSFTIDCTRFAVADTIVTALATGTVAPTTFVMTLVSTTSFLQSPLPNGYYAVDPETGQVFLQAQPHGGIFKEVYNVSATNGAGLTSPNITLSLTTAANCQ